LGKITRRLADHFVFISKGEQTVARHSLLLSNCVDDSDYSMADDWLGCRATQPICEIILNIENTKYFCIMIVDNTNQVLVSYAGRGRWVYESRRTIGFSIKPLTKG
jgi:hypothetical protein